MSKKERQIPGPEKKQAGWIISREYSYRTKALCAFNTMRDTLLQENMDASVLNYVLGEIPHVSLLGEEPLSAKHQK